MKRVLGSLLVVALAVASSAVFAQDRDFRRPPGRLDIDITKPEPKREPVNKIEVDKAPPLKPDRELVYAPAMDSKGKTAPGAAIRQRF